MRHEVKKKASITALSVGIILLLASTANGTGFVDRLHTIAEQAWQDEYIPDSGIPTTPLTEYDNFEVTELFRAVTIEDLEAAITDGYPMPWLEETLKDETIPWEDRYWLDCRMRASIAQNTHTFFNPAGSPIHIDADGIFPGEYYWREYMIVNPIGDNAAGEETIPNLPTHYLRRESGYLLNSFGKKVGDIAVAVNGVALSRDASLGVYVTGHTGEFDSYRDQHYACLLHPDGSFEEIPFSNIGIYGGSISADGSTLVFFQYYSSPMDEDNCSVQIFDNNGTCIREILTDIKFSALPMPPISYNGDFASFASSHPSRYSILLNTRDETVLPSKYPRPGLITSISFTPNGSHSLIFGPHEILVIDLETNTENVFSERNIDSERLSSVSSSNSAVVTAINATSRSGWEIHSSILRIYINDNNVYTESVDLLDELFGNYTPIVSPNGHYIYLTRISAGLGGAINNNPTFILLNISGRI